MTVGWRSSWMFNILRDRWYWMAVGWRSSWMGWMTDRVSHRRMITSGTRYWRGCRWLYLAILCFLLLLPKSTYHISTEMIWAWATSYIWTTATVKEQKDLAYFVGMILQNLKVDGLQEFFSDLSPYLSIALEFALRFLLCRILLTVLPVLLWEVGCCGGGGYLDAWFPGINGVDAHCVEGPVSTGGANPVEDECAIFTAIAMVMDCCTARILSYSWWQNNLICNKYTIIN